MLRHTRARVWFGRVVLLRWLLVFWRASFLRLPLLGFVLRIGGKPCSLALLAKVKSRTRGFAGSQQIVVLDQGGTRPVELGQQDRSCIAD